MQNIEQRIDEILVKLTIEEKVALCHANSKFFTDGVERLGMGELSMSDGPHGVREECRRDCWGPAGWDNDFCTYLPTGTATAATWNPELGHLFGTVLGSEARYREKDIILGPGVNIIRHPLCGRNFEYMSEDPCLIAKMAPGLIDGIQSQDTAACVKHYALNNQELHRGKVNVEVSDRALREIYLKGFEACTNAYSFMGAYNRYNEQHLCHNKVLVKDILKGEWGYDGVYLSDWGGVHDTLEAARYGMDIEMGTNIERAGGDYYLGKPFENLAKNDPEFEALLNDKVRRILRLRLRIHKDEATRQKGEFNTKAHQQAAYTIATESTVLLKNDKKVLPMQNPKRILVMGENATMCHAHGGNSSGVKAFYEVTPLEGIQNRFPDAEIEYVKSTRFEFKPIPVEYLDIAEPSTGCRAFTCEAFETYNWEGDFTTSYVDHVSADTKGKSLRFTATLTIPEDGEYTFHLVATNGSELLFNGEQIKKYKSRNTGVPFDYTAEYKKGDRIDIELLARTTDTTPLEFTWAPVGSAVSPDETLQKAKDADYVIYCGGINHSYDTEGFDKPNLDLPGDQDEIIPRLVEVNPNTVVIMLGGAAVGMPWADKVDTLLWYWYSGMEGGNALADILCGNVVPSGKMPFTLPRKLEDEPAMRYGQYQRDNCKYREDIFVGYRGYDHDNIEPLFPFGYGLSYAEFAYSDLALDQTETDITATFTVTNTGKVTAKEVAQVYVGFATPDATRPPKELKGFEKIELAPGESKTVTVTVAKEDLRIWGENGWCYGTKDYTVSVGTSSRDLPLAADISLNWNK